MPVFEIFMNMVKHWEMIRMRFRSSVIARVVLTNSLAYLKPIPAWLKAFRRSCRRLWITFRVHSIVKAPQQRMGRHLALYYGINGIRGNTAAAWQKRRWNVNCGSIVLRL